MLKKITVFVCLVQLTTLFAMDSGGQQAGASARKGIQATDTTPKLHVPNAFERQAVDKLNESLEQRVAQCKELSPFLRAQLKKEVFNLPDGALKDQLLAAIDQIDRELICEAEETAERRRREAQVAAQREDERKLAEARYQKEKLDAAREKQEKETRERAQREKAARQQREAENAQYTEAERKQQDEKRQRELRSHTLTPEGGAPVLQAVEVAHLLRGTRSKHAEAWQAEKQREAAQRERDEQESLLMRQAAAQVAQERAQHESQERHLVLSERTSKQKKIYEKKKESERYKFLQCQTSFGSCKNIISSREYESLPLEDFYRKSLIMTEDQLVQFANPELTLTDEICEKAQLLLIDLMAFKAHPWIAYQFGFTAVKPSREECEQVRFGKVSFNSAGKPWFEETAPAGAPSATASLQSRVCRYRELPLQERQKIKAELEELSSQPTKVELLSEIKQWDVESQNEEQQWIAEIVEATAAWKERKLEEKAEQLCDKRSFKELDKKQIKEWLQKETELIPKEVDRQLHQLTRCGQELDFFNRELTYCLDRGYDCEPLSAACVDIFLDFEETARRLSDPLVAANQEICDEALKLYIRFKLFREDRWNAYLLHLAAKPSSAVFCESVYGVRRVNRVIPERATVFGNADGEMSSETLVAGITFKNSGLAPVEAPALNVDKKNNSSGGRWWKAGLGFGGVVLAVGFYKWYTTRYKADGTKI